MKITLLLNDGGDKPRAYECANGFVARVVSAVHDENFADAERVRAILNSHDKLVEAGELILKHTERWGLTSARKDAYEKLVAALKLAKGET